MWNALAYIQSGRHVSLSVQVCNPFDCHFCGNLVTTKYDFSPIFSPFVTDKNREMSVIHTLVDMDDVVWWSDLQGVTSREGISVPIGTGWVDVASSWR